MLEIGHKIIPNRFPPGGARHLRCGICILPTPEDTGIDKNSPCYIATYNESYSWTNVIADEACMDVMWGISGAHVNDDGDLITNGGTMTCQCLWANPFADVYTQYLILDISFIHSAVPGCIISLGGARFLSGASGQWGVCVTSESLIDHSFNYAMGLYRLCSNEYVTSFSITNLAVGLNCGNSLQVTYLDPDEKLYNYIINKE